MSKKRWLERQAYLVPKEPKEWVALSVTVVSIALVLFWMWGSLKVLWVLREHVLGLGLLISLWLLAKSHRSRGARRKILRALRKADAPLSAAQVITLMARRGVSPQVVTQGLTHLLGEGLIEAKEISTGVVYTTRRQG